ncbi:MAG: hypothetical protein ACI9LS_001435, partial [Flavobacteriales bacterium]
MLFHMIYGMSKVNSHFAEDVYGFTLDYF